MSASLKHIGKSERKECKMPKVFNTTAVCVPEEHYMVNIEERLRQIRCLIDDGKYFTINQARQYGKTTTLLALNRYLRTDYYIVSIDFQTFGNADFRTEHTFSYSFAGAFLEELAFNQLRITDTLQSALNDLEKNSHDENFGLRVLFQGLRAICSAAEKRLF